MRAGFALRKLAACGRVNADSATLDDKALCDRTFSVGDDAPNIDTIPIGTRADYDAEHAKARYLTPADAADHHFKVSDFRRGGVDLSIHVGCAMVHGKWQCGVH